MQEKVRFARIVELTNIIHELYFFSSSFLNLSLATLIFRLIYCFRFVLNQCLWLKLKGLLALVDN